MLTLTSWISQLGGWQQLSGFDWTLSSPQPNLASCDGTKQNPREPRLQGTTVRVQIRVLLPKWWAFSLCLWRCQLSGYRTNCQKHVNKVNSRWAGNGAGPHPAPEVSLKTGLNWFHSSNNIEKSLKMGLKSFPPPGGAVTFQYRCSF